METPVKTIAPNTLHICSAAEALALLKSHGGHGKAAFMRLLTDAVLDENNHVTGTTGDFNNLIDKYENLGDYYDALRICDFALKIYPRSATLLSIVLNTCSRSGADGERYLQAAERIGRESWNEPRLFKNAAEYCRTRALCCPTEEADAYYEKALSYCRDFQRVFPLDERGCMEEATVLLDRNKTLEAELVLRRVIFEKIIVNNRPQPVNAVNCCKLYLSGILNNSVEYDLILRVAQKGLSFSASELGSFAMGYFSYRLALAKTALVIESDYRNKADIEEALTCCQRAFDLVTFQSYEDDLKRCYVQLCENPQNPIDLKTHRLVKHVLHSIETTSVPAKS